jgi:hypothetical protein
MSLQVLRRCYQATDEGQRYRRDFELKHSTFTLQTVANNRVTFEDNKVQIFSFFGEAKWKFASMQ